MRARKSLLVAVLSFSFLFSMFPSFSAAECVQKDLAGTWYTIVEGGKEEYWWAASKLVVTSTGAVKPTTFKNVDGSTNAVTGGKLTVQSSCEFSGFLKLSENGKSFTAYLDVGALDRSKTSAGGGGHDTTGNPFTFRMIKK